jgi:hypothetical protein
MAIVLLLMVWDTFHHRIRWYLVAWFILVACAFGQWPPWTIDSFRPQLPTWLWQLILLSSGVVLVVGPLVALLRSEIGSQTSADVETTAP